MCSRAPLAFTQTVIDVADDLVQNVPLRAKVKDSRQQGGRLKADPAVYIPYKPRKKCSRVVPGQALARLHANALPIGF